MSEHQENRYAVCNCDSCKQGKPVGGGVAPLTQKEKWLEAMIDKYGSEQAVREEMRRRQEKSMLNPKKQRGIYKGPLNRMSKEQLREFSRRAHEARRQKKHQVRDEV